ncbi:MAG: mandelate racemase/muconate lactonizing enzyme family protein [Planctomycetes bacterium]|nr:mandelate racemase/muconate lactonizing enzyme family protein [Planctomycetota bacterium]
MKIAAVDFFYLAMPEIRDIGDGSQDALLVRVRSDDGFEGWGECEAAPLVSIAAWCCPMSHSACKPVSHGLLGQSLNTPADIRRLASLARRQTLDLLQADHTWSGVDVAFWDLLGKARGEPAWRLLGWKKAYPKLPYASQLFGETPPATFERAREVRHQGFRAAKFGWGPFGKNLAADVAHVRAAREGLGPDISLLVDAGTIWGDDVRAAAARLPVLHECRVLWLEEPFVSGALSAYRDLGSHMKPPLRTAGGEGSHEPLMARNLIDYGQVGYIQIDAGRIGGLSSASDVARYAAGRGVSYVNHTFTTSLALSASLQAYAGLPESELCEFPVQASAMAQTLAANRILPVSDGAIYFSEEPGLGVQINLETLRRYLVDTEIRVAGRLLYQTPAL